MILFATFEKYFICELSAYEQVTCAITRLGHTSGMCSHIIARYMPACDHALQVLCLYLDILIDQSYNCYV